MFRVWDRTVAAEAQDDEGLGLSTFRARGGGLPSYELNAQNGLPGERMDSRAIIGFRQADILARMRGLVPAGADDLPTCRHDDLGNSQSPSRLVAQSRRLARRARRSR